MKKMNVATILLKIILWAVILLIVGDIVMQTISYSFYKGDRKLETVNFTPVKIQIADGLTGYGYHLESDSDRMILFFGGSMDIAYNAVGKYAGYYDAPFLAVDYSGTQDSAGKMNLKTMQSSAEALYDYAVARYPEKKVFIIGHSYGCGMSAYLASVRECAHLFLVSAYRTSADLYNQFIPIYWGPLQVFIRNNIRIDHYAGNTTCPVTIIGSDADTTLSVALQEKVAALYDVAEMKIFSGVPHADYLITRDVIDYLAGEMDR